MNNESSWKRVGFCSVFKSIVIILVMIAGVVGIPYGLDFLIPLINSNVGNNEIWLNFWSVWLGAFIGATVTIVGVYLTLKSSKKQFNITLEDNKDQYRKTLNADRERYEEDRRLSLMPHLKLSLKQNSTFQKEKSEYEYMLFNVDEKKPKQYNFIERIVRLRNIGLGSALNIKIKICEFPGVNLQTSENSTIDLGVNDSIDIALRLYEFPDEKYDFTLYYTDILNKCMYEQSGYLVIKEHGVRAIIQSMKTDSIV